MPLCVCVCVCVHPPYVAQALISQNAGFSPTYVNAFPNIFRLWQPLRQPFYKHAPLTWLGLWYSALGHPHVKTLSLFYSASKCPHRAAPLSCMEAFLPLLDLWLATQSASSLWISSILDLDFCSECQASILFNILQTNWASLCKLLFSMNAS